MSTAVDVAGRVGEIARGWREQRGERQARRHLEQADFDALREAGLLTLPVPVEQGGCWEGAATSARTMCGIYRHLAGADPSVALVSCMHPAVIGYWLMTPGSGHAAWEAQRGAVFAGALAGEQGYGVSGMKHFGSGSGIADRMVTTAIPDGEDTPALFVLDVVDRPWDGTAGLELIAEWDGVAMKATQSHGMRLDGAPAVRAAWDGPIEDLTGPAIPLVAMLFTSVVLGVLDAAVAEARPRVADRAETLRAYEQVEWTRAESDHWLAVQAWDGAMRSLEDASLPAAIHAALRAKESIADLAEDTLRRLTRVLGGGTLSARAPFAHWFEDVRALGFLRPPWGLAYDALFATSLVPPE
jgi:alkylation response protein AidB-like acyl-CoA dehydrogenase